MARAGRDHTNSGHAEPSRVRKSRSDGATTHADVFRLQRLAGNQAVGALLGAGLGALPVQRMGRFAAKTAFDKEESREVGLKYGGLISDWLLVHGAKSDALLEPIAGKEQLKELLDEWERGPTQKDQVIEAKRQLAEEERRQWVEKYEKQAVFMKLTEGLDGDSDASTKLATLLANYRKHGPDIFDYTMVALSPDRFFRGGMAGDCNTLTYSFKDIAVKLLGLPVEIRSSRDVGYPQRFFTPAHRTIDGKTGNVAGKYWAFENHFWITFAGVDYDVLFGEQGKLDTSNWVRYKGEEGKLTLFGEPPNQYKLFETGKGKIEDRYEFISGPG